MRLPLRGLINPFGEPRIVLHIRRNHLLPGLRHPSRNSLAHFQPDILQRLGRLAHRDGEVKLTVFFVHHQQRPRIRAEVFRHFFHDGLQNGIKIQRRRQRFRHVVEDGQFLALARQLGAGGLGHAGSLIELDGATVPKIIGLPRHASNDRW